MHIIVCGSTKKNATIKETNDQFETKTIKSTCQATEMQPQTKQKKSRKTLPLQLQIINICRIPYEGNSTFVLKQHNPIITLKEFSLSSFQREKDIWLHNSAFLSGDHSFAK